MAWTEAQRDAISIRGRAVIVSAAAGSGKTSVLVERLAQLLADCDDKIPAEQMAVVTFTNDAAQGMRMRLTAELEKRISENPENTWLREQLLHLGMAKISTIHAFCFDLIRENLSSLNITAGFRIADGMEQSVLLSEAVNAAIEEGCRFRREETDLLYDFFCTRTDAALEEIVTSLYKFLLSVPFGEDWLETVINRCKAPFSPDTDILAESYLRTPEQLYRKAARMAELACGYASDIGADKPCELMKSEAEAFLSAAERLRDKALPWDERVAFNISFAAMRFPKIEKGSPEEMEKERIQALRNAYKKLITGIRELMLSTEQIEEDYRIHADILSALRNILASVRTEMNRVKAEKNLLDFSDAEQLTLKLLAVKREDGTLEKSSLAKELSEFYRVIMVDEFQDSNNIQDLIFKLLSNGGTAERNGDSFFAVGDIKQSIYRFRQANPKIFLRMTEQSERYSEECASKNVSVMLNKNFRSSREVVDFVNFIFRGIMSVRVGELDYSDDEALVMGASYDDEPRPTEIIMARSSSAAETENADTGDASADDAETGEETSDTPEDDGDPEAMTAEEMSGIELEAEAVAAKISGMIKSGCTVTENGVKRPCRGGDFCVLMRDRARGAYFSKTLSGLGIGSRCEEVTGYLSSREISVLLNLLRVADNPLQDIPLLSVLMSPMFMLDADEIARIRLLNRDGFLYQAVQEALSDEHARQSFYPKLLRFRETVNGIRIKAARGSVESVIRSIYDDTDFIGVMNTFDDGDRKQANLKLLISYVSSYESASTGGLSGFLRYVDGVSRSGGDFSQASSAVLSEDTVAIKTIHKSKGLEYPFVFLCGISKAFNTRDFSASVITNAELGIGLKIRKKAELKRYPSYQFAAIRDVNFSEQLSEEMRLLYVALTRARERLFITFADRKTFPRKLEKLALSYDLSGGILTPDMCAEGKSFEDWLLMALARHPDCGAFRRFGSIPVVQGEVPSVVYSEYVCGGDTGAAAESEVAEEITEAELETAAEKIRQAMLDGYDYSLSRLPAKLTVTDISKTDALHSQTAKKPLFALEADDISAADIGTATHAFLEHADFRAARISPENELERLVGESIISEATAERVSLSSLKSFFAGELCERMLKSEKIERERKFLVRISDIGLDDELGRKYNNTIGMLQGIVDCVFHEEDGVVLLDYKTDRVATAQQLADRYRTQLELYKLAMRVVYSKPVKGAYIYSLRLNTTIEI